ncbi:hypothetical protein G4B88_007736 [Cannabis sativa]|uniref:Uncharacterized protein n=1 Tax=Cannabis sativa TaxID=3483 RepID=A0A7J6HH98_CANSA|nr:hypothetical protein G4B88_007736 [Cannabis sativa]
MGAWNKSKFGRCADRLGAWNKSKFGSIARLVREAQNQLDDLLSVSAPLVRMDEVKRLETKLNDLLSREECYWKLRSPTGRKKKNAIVEIMTEDGRKLSMEEDIVGEIERYFGTIFSSASPTVQQSNFALLAMVWWSVWFDRNFVLFGKKQFRLEVLDVLAREAWEEFRGVGVSSGGQVLGALASGTAGVGVGGGGGGQGMSRRGCGESGRGRWCPPVVGEFVLSMDAATLFSNHNKE